MLDINLNNYHSEVSRFTGTEAYHRWTPLSKSVLTDGAKYVAEQLQAYWLFDEIDLQIKHGKMPKLDMYFTTFTVSLVPPQRLESAKLSIEDGNGKVLKTKSIDYTDFPLPEIKIWSASTATEQSGQFFVHMLPSEY